MSNLSDTLGMIADDARNEFIERLTAIIKDEAGKLIDVIEIVKQVDVAGLVRQAIYDHFRQCVANEIGNRLRCGIYDGTKVDRLFESVWTSELDKAIQDRIRTKVNKAIDAVVAERLRSV
jgi:hypothetical protein